MLRNTACAIALLAAAISPLSLAGDAGSRGDEHSDRAGVQLGPRPFFLVEDMADSRLKRKLQSCSNGPFRQSDFSIGHRGAALQFPEHTEESYRAGARMGAGILECDVTFTKDKELVCRHAQCDLHTTTNILATALAAKCRVPFTPAVLNADGSVQTAARVQCCTSDLTLDEFRTLRGKMDDFDRAARTPAQYMRSTNTVRTDLYAGPTSGTLLTHKESIQLFKRLGAKMTPELKAPEVTMPFDGFTQEQYAQKMIDEYKQAGIPPRNVFPQSFNINDVLYWVRHEPRYGKQAVFLDDANSVADLPSFADLQGYKRQGINIWAPPLFALLIDDGRGNIVASQAAKDAKDAGLDIITWTLERSGILADGNNGFYYQTYDKAVSREGDMFRVVDALAKEVGVLGIFSDWAATVTYYASCMNLK
jgi:glycerophosphoryl diester phosphodiesterase